MEEKEKTKLCGNTSDSAETIIDYRKGTTDIKGVPQDTLVNRVKSAFGEYAVKLVAPYIILMVAIYWILQWILQYEIEVRWIAGTYILIVCLLSVLHINKKFNYRMKRYFAVRTGAIKRNKIKLSDLNSDKFVLYGFKNIVLEYEAKGDVARKLNKIWVKQEHPSSVVSDQGRVSDMLYLKNEPVWNAHFMFDDVPKDGYLYIEWV